MLKPITTPPRTRTLNLEDLTIELSGVSDLLLAFSFQYNDSEGSLADNKAADALYALSRYIDRINDDFSEFTIGRA